MSGSGNPPDGGGIIIIHGHRPDGTEGPSPYPQVTSAQAADGIAKLRAGNPSAGALACATALENAMNYANG